MSKTNSIVDFSDFSFMPGQATLESLNLEALARALEICCDDPSSLAQLAQRNMDSHGPEAIYLCGEWLLLHDRQGPALGLLSQAACAMPEHLLAAHNHAEALRQCGQYDDAVLEFQRAIKLQTDFLPSRLALIDLIEQHTLPRLRVIAPNLAKDQAKALGQLLSDTGNLLYESGQGYPAWDLYKRALVHDPASAAALSNLGNILHQEGRLAEAEDHCRRALAINPQLGAAWNNLGNVLAEQERVLEAASCYDRACEFDPRLAKQAEHNKLSGTLFNILHSDRYSDAEVFERHKDWGRQLGCVPPEHGPLNWIPGEPIRVGYLSADFRSHAMRHYLEPLLAGHDPARVEVICYMQNRVEDEYTARLMSYGHRWVRTHELDDEQLIAQIRADGIHILIDCLGHTQGTRITALARKPAPIQMSYLGYLGSTGLPAMDYRLTDAWLDPPGLTDDLHTETLLRVPGGSVAYMPHINSPDVNELPALQLGHVTFGSLNKLKKLNLNVVRLWSEILHAAPMSRLLLKTKQLADPLSAGRVVGLFEAHGIAADRLELQPATQDHLQAYHGIDIALDPFPFGGGATTCDALWMGVPVVTTPGTRSASRLTHSLLHTLGRPEWSVPDQAAYVRKALELTNDLQALAAIRQSLRQQMQTSPLMDARGTAQRLENMFEQICTVALPHERRSELHPANG